ncbi:MAG: CRTAC1 family protein [Acidobacteriota bacterium]
MRRRLGIALVALACCVTGCGPSSDDGSTSTPSSERFVFTDVAAELGLDFQQTNGDEQRLLILESVGAGAALFDADRDGWLDVYFVDGAQLQGFETRPGRGGRLYRSEEGRRFTDVTEEMGLSTDSWGQAVAVADLDGDGGEDLVLSNYGPNEIFLSSPGAGHRKAGPDVLPLHDDWSSGGCLFDADLDGDLDLYFANYIDFAPVIALPEKDRRLQRTFKGLRVQLGPAGLPPAHDRYLLNDDGRFVDVTEGAGFLTEEPRFAFQPMAGDLDDDGDPDLFVPNDTMANHLWRNDGGRFEEIGVAAGVSYSAEGRVEGSMGVLLDDLDGDLDLDLFITNFGDEDNAYHRNEGGGFFEESGAAVGLGGSTAYQAVGWGLVALDVDRDGEREIFVANGHVFPQVDQLGEGLGYAQPDLLYVKGANGRYERAEGAGLAALSAPGVSRGTAAGDFDRDGDVDLLVSELGGRPRLLRNDGARAGHWLAVHLVGRAPNTSAIGAEVVLSAGGKRRLRVRHASSGYAGSDAPELDFGLGEVESCEGVEVTWPTGERERFDCPGVDRVLRLEQGSGRS